MSNSKQRKLASQPINVPIEPEFYTVYLLKINKDIYKTNLNTYTNVCKMSLEGQIIKGPDGEALPDNKDFLYLEKAEKTKTKGIESYTINSNDGEVLNVPDSVEIYNWIKKQLEKHPILNSSDSIEIVEDTIQISDDILSKIHSAIQPSEFDDLEKRTTALIEKAKPQDYEELKNKVTTNENKISSAEQILSDLSKSKMNITDFNSTIKAQIIDFGYSDFIKRENSSTVVVNVANTIKFNCYAKANGKPVIIENGKILGYATTEELALKQKKLIAGANIHIAEDGTITATDTGVSAEYVKEQIAAAKLDPTIREEVQAGLVAPMNKKIEVLQQKDVELQKEVNKKVDIEQLKEVIKILVAQINDKQDPIIAGNHLELVDNTLNVVLPDMVQSIMQMGTNKVFVTANNAYKNIGNGDEILASEKWANETFATKEELSSSTKHIFFDGECRYFKTKTQADVFIKAMDLTSDDISITTPGYVIGTGKNGSYVQYKLQPNDIPYLSFSGSTDEIKGDLIIQSKVAWVSSSKILPFLTEMNSNGYVKMSARRDSARCLDWSPDPVQADNYSVPTDENTEYTYTLNHSHSFSGSVGTNSNNYIKSSFLERYEIVFKRKVVR